MKNRRFVVASLAVLLLCLLAGWRFFAAKKVGTSPQVPVKQNQKQTKGVAGQQAAQVEGVGSLKWKMQKTLATANDRPIEYYGRAIDQHGQPVGDAEVVGMVIVYAPRKEGVEKYQSKTDLNGEFQLNGFMGESMGVAVTKAGYEQAPQSGGGIFSLMYPEKDRYKPDSKNPQIIPMWKLAGAEPMVECRGKEYRVPSNGQITTFDLLAGKMSAGDGDIRVAIWQDKPAVGEARKGDWGYKIEAVGGGLLESMDRFMYLAPESGYQPRLEGTLQASSTNWVEGVEKQLYLKSRGGRNYGRLTIKVWCDYDRPDTAVRIESFLNPSGSRNLEWDPEKRISPRRIEEVGLEKALEEARGKLRMEN